MPLQTPVLALARLAEEGHSGGVNPWIIGATALGILLFLLFVVVAIGGGRDHT
ncbi:hypothetical protein [Nocardioides marmoribigeumensis]|uniref:Uncharacterized protein n=1 Tax=Nocardioides marmoribigeumensis TaxID=433649 RepID=A0ABU2C0S2_9ACTN|nr:hypothetical protein [Nocardioides marmoribigeumensis]MDR7364242.1 hypothetical protein [Nocardioides marmoribigeumensis]